MVSLRRGTFGDTPVSNLPRCATHEANIGGELTEGPSWTISEVAPSFVFRVVLHAHRSDIFVPFAAFSLWMLISYDMVPYHTRSDVGVAAFMKGE